jgi:hypothetical protein
MSHPFGGHPTLGRFVEFAQQHGCAADVVVLVSRNGSSHEVLHIKGSAARQRVAIVDPDPNERLAPSTVTYYQRRLGIKSPYPAAPEPSAPEDDVGG